MRNDQYCFSGRIYWVGIWLAAFLIFPLAGWPASVSQRTEGPCSPAVADVKGNVNIECKGVDQKAVDDIIKLLNEILLDTRKLEQLRGDLDKASKRTDEIEARQAGRRLTQEQRLQLVHLLSMNSGTPFSLSVLANDAEGLNFARDIGSRLLMAGWKMDEGISQLTIIGEIPVGIYIPLKDFKNPPPGALILIKSFGQVGLKVDVEEKPKSPTNKLEIIIGAKPQ